MRRLILALLALLAIPAAALAKEEPTSGPVFTTFGQWYPVENMQPVPTDQKYRVIFDSPVGAKPGELNPQVDRAARFINQLAAAGVPRENIEMAIVVHSSASEDVTNDAAYARKYPGQRNASAAAIAEMVAQGVEFYICGQAAHGHGIVKADLLPGVKMALSQTVATAILHQRGFQNIP